MGKEEFQTRVGQTSSVKNVRDSLLADVERTLFGPQARIGKDEIEKARSAMCKLLVPEYEAGVPAFKSLPEAYIHMTGDLDITGMFNPGGVSKGLRSCMDFNSSSFGYALGDAMSMQLSKAYKGFPYHEEVLISEKKKAVDFREIHSVQLGYLGDLPDVDPETSDYESIASYDDTEATYRLGQKGAIISVTRRIITNDSIGLIQAMTKRMARAARMTHARYVWDAFISNTTCPDGTGWFTEAHGNLGTDALDYSPLVTAITALANMTEPGSDEKIGLDLGTFNWHLVVPVALWELAVQKNQGKSHYSLNDLTSKTINACYRLFGEFNERIVTCPFLTDANDWGVIRDKEDVPIVEMSYLNGQEDPELILTQGPKDTMAFVADKLGYKIRHEYGGVLAGYRGGYKSAVG